MGRKTKRFSLAIPELNRYNRILQAPSAGGAPKALPAPLRWPSSMTQYPKLGTVVTFLRVDDKRKVHTGKGIVQAIILNPGSPFTVQVKEGKNAYNINSQTINYNQEKIAVYQKLITETDKISKEGNKLIEEFAKETTEEYNNKIKKLFVQAFGKE